MADKLRAKGRVIIKVIDAETGKVIRTIKGKNLIVDVGRGIVTQLLNNSASTGQYITKIQAGTSGTAPAAYDTAITAPFTKAIDGATFPSLGVVDFAWHIETTENNGMTIAEFGLLCDDGSLFARKVVSPAIVKTSSIRLDSVWEITF